jgi:hypothetical protein
MKRKNLLMSLTLAGALSALGSQAHATSWMDFDDAAVGGLGISNDSANPTVLNQVTVVCPASGFLVATATSTAFLRNLVGTKTTGAVVFSITFNGTNAQNEAARTVVVQNLGPNTFANIPASLQRVEACNSGETRTYYHTAHGSIGPGNQVATEGRSRLVVEFFDTRI